MLRGERATAGRWTMRRTGSANPPTRDVAAEFFVAAKPHPKELMLRNHV